jgi:hypothetical protein
MIERLNPILIWRKISNKEKRAFLFGALFGIILMVPILAIGNNTAQPISYSIVIIEDKIIYNNLYTKYCNEIGNATNNDRVLLISPLVNNDTYRNLAIQVGFSESITLRYICFLSGNDTVIEKIKSPIADEPYIIENMDNINSVVIFLYSTLLTYSVKLWVW